MHRQPFSAVVSEADFLLLWTTTWHISLATWRSVLGIFNWLMLPLVSASRGTPRNRFVKSMLANTLLQIGLDNWEIASAVMDSALRFQC